jgi:Lrp/AsnC family transcriptional regulator, leucine-responsive regulatory protein
MDKFDRKIIEILDKNSRLPLSKISKEIRLSKQSIARRINYLYSSKKLFSYYLIVDYFKLGLNNAIFFLSFNKTDKEKLHEKVEEIEKLDSVAWIADFFGDYDQGISIFYQSQYELNKIICKIQEIYRNIIKKTNVISMVEHNIFSFEFDKKNRVDFHISQNSHTKLEKISVLQKKILHELSNNVRNSSTEIAKRLSASPTGVRYNIKQLEKNKTILGYKLLINFSKFGFHWGLVLFSCNHSPELSKLIVKLKNDSKVILISRSVTNDLLVDLLYHDVAELKEFVEEYKLGFSNICNSKTLNVIHVHKLSSYLN